MISNDFKKISQNVALLSLLLLCNYYLLVMYSTRPGVDNIQFLVIDLFLKLFQGSWLLILVYSQVTSNLDNKDVTFKRLFIHLRSHLLIFILAIILLKISNPNFSLYQEFSNHSLSTTKQIISIFIISLLMTFLDFITNQFKLSMFNKKSMVIFSFLISFIYLLNLKYAILQFTFLENDFFNSLYMINILFWFYFFCLAKWVAHNLEAILNFLNNYIVIVYFLFLGSFILIIYLEFKLMTISPFLNPLYLVVYTTLFCLVLNAARIFIDKDSMLIEILSERIYIISLSIPITAQIFKTVYNNYFDSTFLFIIIGTFFTLSSATGFAIFLKPLKKFKS